ncbi:uncharacterized protein Z519_10253 [Cladophialophora bantiana CBS 173.52]|uniref:Murein transglycosylase n=1 Tax=Cladophialophora bantiana (strain ATCC 10958 / CBS 173.52 / CDC B-1940 / NIH 8579) TaxID=1442370 RepID=A0A0D2HXW2_CLAB1|nr:uncharacterized protein Z519_10253 [Cladophialophora bantiana CBS 173.52]KIW89399.1 hypothetical protein Z519_10253 [Cladophialophora bantiana CBS 173.52]
MRAIIPGLAALCAPVVLAIPHGGNRRHQHAMRHEGAIDFSTVTDVVTVTANNAVVWVDQYNNVLSTEYRDHPTPTTIASSSQASLVVVETESPPSPGPAQASNSPFGAHPHASESAAAPPVSSSESAEPVPAAPSSEMVNSSPPPVASVVQPLTTSNTAPAEKSMAAAMENGNSYKGVKGGANAGANAAGGGYGICYELIGSNGCKDQGTMDSEFGFLASQGYSKIRFYDIGCDLSVATAAAAAQGLQVMLGLNTIGNVAGDLGTLVGMINGNWGPVDTIVIGNEVVNSGGAAAAVVTALDVARPILQAAGFTKNIVTVDTFAAHQNNPSLCQASDYCAVNAHAFFDPNTSASNAGSFVEGVIAPIAKKANGKQIIVTESGWPYQGQPNGQAIPSPANQQTAINALKSAFSSNPGGVFLFQAYDATYKAPGAFGVEQFFGIYGH